jgi:hypothetical protein
VNNERGDNSKIADLLNRVLNEEMIKEDYELLKNCLKNQKDSNAY